MVYSLSQDGSLKIVRGSYSVNSKSVGFRASRLSDFVIGHNLVSFSDVPKDAWYKDALTFVAARDIFPVTVGKAVSYTHLDVYKRQYERRCSIIIVLPEPAHPITSILSNSS